MKRAAWAVGLALAVGWGGVALAGDARREEARAAFDRAERAARELRFQEALDGYEEASSRDPTAPFSPVARARAEDLRARSEGAFGPLARLEAVRRDPALNRDRAAIEALERDAAGFPEGRVRSEALLVVAQAYAHALGEPRRAIAALERVLEDRGSDRSTRALSLSEVVALYRAERDTAAALRAVEREPELLPSLTREVRAEALRGKVAAACLGVLAALAAAAAWGGARAARRLGDVRALAPLVLRRGPLLFAFYVGAGGAMFVRLHGGEGDPTPFLGLGLAVAVTSILVRLWAAGDRATSRGAAALRAGLGALGLLSAAYLILWGLRAEYLAPLGL